MADQRDTILLEEAKTRRDRLGSSLLYGAQPERRRVVDNVKRFVASIIVAAVAAAACVGISFVSDILSKQAAQKQEQQQLQEQQQQVQKDRLEQQQKDLELKKATESPIPQKGSQP